MNEKKLEKIFNHYKKGYNLNTRFEYDIDGYKCSYKVDIDFISLGGKLLKGTFRKRLNIKSEKYVLILALLHEIKHAIDKDIIKNELKSIDISEYQYNSEYHDTTPFEVRADIFARQEFNKWSI